MEKIGKYQIIAMTILFMIGSTPLYELGIEAKQDAWLVVLVAMLAGLLLLCIYLYIQNKNSEHALPQILNQCFGKYLGSLLRQPILFILLTNPCEIPGSSQTSSISPFSPAHRCTS